jgi:hypothetical protein
MSSMTPTRPQHYDQGLFPKALVATRHLASFRVEALDSSLSNLAIPEIMKWVYLSSVSALHV